MKKLLLATDLSPRILKEVVSNRADLLVLATHGRTGVAHAFLGSVAEELLAAAPSRRSGRPGLVITAVRGPARSTPAPP